MEERKGVEDGENKQDGKDHVVLKIGEEKALIVSLEAPAPTLPRKAATTIPPSAKSASTTTLPSTSKTSTSH